MQYVSDVLIRVFLLFENRRKVVSGKPELRLLLSNLAMKRQGEINKHIHFCPYCKKRISPEADFRKLRRMISVWKSTMEAADWTTFWSERAGTSMYEAIQERWLKEQEIEVIGTDWSVVGHDLGHALKEIERRKLAAAE